jgi:hypothetical protein
MRNEVAARCFTPNRCEPNPWYLGGILQQKAKAATESRRAKPLIFL